MKWKTLSSEYLRNINILLHEKINAERRTEKLSKNILWWNCQRRLVRSNYRRWEVLMVKQYRHPIEETFLEIPGGFMDENEVPERAIKRELKEETGYEFSSIDHVGKIAANPGVLNNFTYFFLAKGGKKTGVQKLDNNEDLEVVNNFFT